MFVWCLSIDQFSEDSRHPPPKRLLIFYLNHADLGRKNSHGHHQARHRTHRGKPFQRSNPATDCRQHHRSFAIAPRTGRTTHKWQCCCTTVDRPSPSRLGLPSTQYWRRPAGQTFPGEGFGTATSTRSNVNPGRRHSSHFIHNHSKPTTAVARFDHSLQSHP